MPYSLTRRMFPVVLAAAGLIVLGMSGSAAAQSGGSGALTSSDVAVQNLEKSQADAATATGRTAQSRWATLGASGGAPVALALEEQGPGPSSTPEPLSVLLVGGALAGLYRMRKHIS